MRCNDGVGWLTPLLQGRGAGLSAIISGNAIQELREGGRWKRVGKKEKGNVAKHDVYTLEVEQESGERDKGLNKTCSRTRGEEKRRGRWNKHCGKRLEPQVYEPLNKRNPPQ